MFVFVFFAFKASLKVPLVQDNARLNSCGAHAHLICGDTADSPTLRCSGDAIFKGKMSFAKNR